MTRCASIESKTSRALPASAWVVVFLVFLVVSALPASAQDDQEFVPDEPAESASSEEEDLGDFDDEGEIGFEEGEFVPEGEAFGGDSFGEGLDLGNVDDLLAADEEVMSDPGTYSYEPGARRDPFRSLLRQRDTVDRPTERPEGLPGLLIDELRVQGIFMLPEGPVAQVMSSRQETSFLIRPGDELWDGDVERITLDEVVFKQEVNDPTALKPFREIVKKLDPAR